MIIDKVISSVKMQGLGWYYLVLTIGFAVYAVTYKV